MIKLLFIFLCLTVTIFASIKKADTPTTLVTPIYKPMYTSTGDVDLQKIVELKENDSVSFKVGDSTFNGKVSKVDLNENSLTIFGEFSVGKSGFVFRFTREQVVSGALFFVEQSCVYNLKQKSEDVFYFEKQPIKVQ
jgi:hypothetical protein